MVFIIQFNFRWFCLWKYRPIRLLFSFNLIKRPLDRITKLVKNVSFRSRISVNANKKQSVRYNSVSWMHWINTLIYNLYLRGALFYFRFGDTTDQWQNYHCTYIKCRLFYISSRDKIEIFNLPESICIQPHMWKTVVDFIKNIIINEEIVSSEVSTDKPTKIVATWRWRRERRNIANCHLKLVLFIMAMNLNWLLVWWIK